MNRQSIISGSKHFLNFLFWMLIFGFAIRLFESALLGHYQEEFLKQLKLCMIGYGYDILFFSKISLGLFAIFLLIHRFSEKAAKWTLRIVGTLMLLISNVMIMYYISALLPLDRIIFNYTVEELLYISQSTGAFVWWAYAGLVLIPILFLIFSGKKINIGDKVGIVWIALAFIGFFFNKVPVWTYNNRTEMNTIGNKQEFFFKSILIKEEGFLRFNRGNLEQQKENIQAFQSFFPENKFVDYYFPFAHVDKSPDVLSEYFDLDPKKMPNLVFILTEGLSREFSGYNSLHPSATPFLDSLAEASLSWINCMSSSQRTIGVLPSVFGSLPFGERGFMQSSNCPRFYSMVEILKNNGYQPSFFYGGWTCFDDMCYFLNDMGVDNYLTPYENYPKEMQSTWGLYDEYLFSEALKTIKEDETQPRLDIYMTLTTHDPFDYPNKEHYTKIYTDKLIKNNKQHSIGQYLYEQYASFLYYDDCLRNFFHDYCTKPGYENTIFVITGDHCFNGTSEELDKYHVPLIIWSPMLKEARRFPALVAHRDITPSILALIKHKYGIDTPNIVSWLNTGLDTSPTFRSLTFSPQQKNSRKLDNMVIKDYFYDEGMIFKFEYNDDKLAIKPVDNDKIVQFMNLYKSMDDYVMNNDALVKIDLSKQETLFAIDSTQSEDYCHSLTYTKPIDTLDKTQIFHLKNNYPFNIYTGAIEEDLESISIAVDFDIYIPKTDESEKIRLALALDHADGDKEVLKTITINYDWYEYYDRWNHFSMTQRINRSVANFKIDDQLKCYLVNGKFKDFYISNFELKVIGEQR